MSQAEPVESRDTYDPAEWYERALDLMSGGSKAEQQQFARDVVGIHGRVALNNHEYSARIQKGLVYDLDPDPLADDFVTSVSNWHVYVPPMSNGELVQAEIESHTIDTGFVEHPGPGDFEQQPRRETTTFVDCWLELEVALSQYGHETDALVTVVQADHA